MNNKWYHKDGFNLITAYPHICYGVVIAAPDDNVKGNVAYVDSSHPDASDVAANAGCVNVPFVTLEAAGASGSLMLIVAKGVYTFTSPLKVTVVSDTLFSVVVNASGGGNCRVGIVRGVFGGTGSNNPTDTFQINSILDNPNAVIVQARNCLVLKLPAVYGLFRNHVFISQTVGSTSADILSLFYNCVVSRTVESYMYDRTFWLGTLNYNGLTSDLGTICPLIGTTYATEADAIAKVETDLALTAGDLAGNGFRLLNPHFINSAKGNFNIDFENYDCTEILAIRDANEWIINRGVRCEFPTDFVGGAGFGHSPDTGDGFSGELYSRNINSSGAITDAGDDMVLVSKKYTLSVPMTLENINYFDKLITSALELSATVNDGTDTPNLYTFYLIGVPFGSLETDWNNGRNSFSYSAGVLTTDFPIFILNRETELNKVGNSIFGKIDNGTFDLDEARNIFEAGLKQFRIIAVKKGV